MKSVRPWGLGFWETWCRRRGIDRPFCSKHRVGWNKGEGKKGQLPIADLHPQSLARFPSMRISSTPGNSEYLTVRGLGYSYYGKKMSHRMKVRYIRYYILR